MKKEHVTFVLLSYNQERFITQAVESVLNQTYSPLDIIISDDCSTDTTYDLICKAVQDYNGPHKILLQRNKKNLGLIQHFNLLMSMVTTNYVIIGAGDDISVATRTEKIVAEFLSDPNINCIHSATNKIDEWGNHLGKFFHPTISNRVLIKQFARSMCLIIGATAAYKKTVFSLFGPIKKHSAVEDLIFAFRAILIGKVKYLEESLVNYRFGVGLSTSHLSLLKKDIYSFTKEKKRIYHMKLNVLMQRSIDLRTCRKQVVLNKKNYFTLRRILLTQKIIIMIKLSFFIVVDWLLTFWATKNMSPQ